MIYGPELLMAAALMAAGTLASQGALTRGGHRSFSQAFRLTRGAASVVLASMGFLALVGYRTLSPRLYVSESVEMFALVLVGLPVGHFFVDLALIAWGWGRHGARPRVDLIAHHTLGLVAAMAVLAYPLAAPLYLVLFTTELMPITTAVTALGVERGSARLERVGAVTRVAVLILWRLPLWAWVGVTIVRNVSGRQLASDEAPIYAFSAAFLLVTTTLDVFWTRQAVRRLRG